MRYTIALSGPAEARERALVALETARVPVCPPKHHAPMDWKRKYPDSPADEAWLTVLEDHPDNALRVVEDAGFVLRAHYHTPDPPDPDPAEAFMRSVDSRLSLLESQAQLKPMAGCAVESPGAYNQNKQYAAEQMRRASFAWLARTASNSPGIVSGGLLSGSDLQLSAPASGLSTNLSTGEAFVGGGEGGAQGGYYVRGTSQTNLVISTANATNPRIDTVVATVADSAYTEPSDLTGDQWAPVVLTGTPTAGATLANLLGAASVPLSSLLLGYVLVPANATSIVTADIANIANPFVFQGIGGPTVRGTANIAAGQGTTSTTYTTLSTPDQVAGIVLPSNGLLIIGYHAIWQESVAGIGRAAIFLGANQLKIPSSTGSAGSLVTQAAATNNSSAIVNLPLATTANGLMSTNVGAGSYPGDTTTGQIIGISGNGGSLQQELGGTVISSGSVGGGPCMVFATAGTYTISVQYKVSAAGTVTASNRQLWVQAIPFT